MSDALEAIHGALESMALVSRCVDWLRCSSTVRQRMSALFRVGTVLQGATLLFSS